MPTQPCSILQKVKTPQPPMQSQSPESVLLTAWLGKSKTAGNKIVSAHINSLPMGERFYDERLAALVKFSPGRKFSQEITTFALRARAPYFTKALFVESRSGGFVDCSWKNCVAHFFGKYSKAQTVHTRALNALRNEAFRSEKMKEARAELGDKCAECDKVCKKLVVDHAGMPFAQIVDEYVVGLGTSIDALGVSYAKGAYRLRSGGKGWRKFHDERAELVGLCAGCNSRLGSRGYRSVGST